MDHTNHVRLLQNGIHVPEGVWAEFGSGRGAFTLALAELLTPSAQIHSVDLDRNGLRTQRETLQAQFPDKDIQYHAADFTQQLDLPPLDGIVMANSLHFVWEKKPVLRLIHSYLKDSGRLILVEYNTDKGNQWVPYPLSFTTWESLAAEVGFVQTRLLHTVPSSFLGQFYSACSEKVPST
jgi:ubiquinone/menaquinone biosynthesis C-methylase UbiE